MIILIVIKNSHHTKKLLKKKALEYYYANKEGISQKRKETYKQMPPGDKKKLVEYNKQWFYRQSPKRQRELQEKARKYHKIDMIM